MTCYFLNVRNFRSKSKNECYLLTVANKDGEVSEFFITSDLYESLCSSFAPFDLVSIELSYARGRCSVLSVEHVVE